MATKNTKKPTKKVTKKEVIKPHNTLPIFLGILSIFTALFAFISIPLGGLGIFFYFLDKKSYKDNRFPLILNIVGIASSIILSIIILVGIVSYSYHSNATMYDKSYKPKVTNKRCCKNKECYNKHKRYRLETRIVPE